MTRILSFGTHPVAGSHYANRATFHRLGKRSFSMASSWAAKYLHSTDGWESFYDQVAPPPVPSRSKLAGASARSRRIRYESGAGASKGHYLRSGRSFAGQRQTSTGSALSRRVRNRLASASDALHYDAALQDQRHMETLTRIELLSSEQRLLRESVDKLHASLERRDRFGERMLASAQRAWLTVKGGLATQAAHLEQLSLLRDWTAETARQMWLSLRLTTATQLQSLKIASSNWTTGLTANQRKRAVAAYVSAACCFGGYITLHSTLNVLAGSTIMDDMAAALDGVWKLSPIQSPVEVLGITDGILMTSLSLVGAFRRGGSRLLGFTAKGISTSVTASGVRKTASYRDLVENHSAMLERPFPMAEVLDDLRNLQALRSGQQARPYRVAERRLFKIQHEHESGAALSLRDVTGLLEPDDSVAWTAIRERLLLGGVRELQSLSKERRAKMTLSRVYGIGPRKADKFVAAGVLTLDQLRDAPLETAQRIGLRHLTDIESLIPRQESQLWHEKLQHLFRHIDPKLTGVLLGSFRRGDFFPSDLDWVLFHPDIPELWVPKADNVGKMVPNSMATELLDKILDALKREELLADDLLAHGPLAAKGLVRLGPHHRARRIDINFAPYQRRAFYLLAKTGDSDLMVHMRSRAKAKGLALNEYGIGPPNVNGSAWRRSILNATEEREVFDFLGIPYLKPEERNFATYHAKLGMPRYERW